MSDPANPFEQPPPAPSEPPPPSRPGLRAIGLVVLSAAVAGFGLGVYRGYDVATEIEAGIAEYDTYYDPIVIEHGVMRVEGTRVPGEAGKFYVDPNDEIDLDAIEGEAIVLGKTELTQVRAFDQRSYRYADVLEDRTIRIDSANGAAFLDEYGHWIWATVLTVMMVFVAPFHVAECALLTSLAAWLTKLLLRAEAPPYRVIATRALSLSAALPPLWTLANLVGWSTNCCVDLFVFGPLLVGATWLSMRRAS